MRKLVTIRKVDEVNPIEGADSIECLTIEGWKVVSQKGNFRRGELAVYFEIDSFLPDGNPLWQDLVDKSSREFEGKKGHVLRTIKLRGQVSQGFAIPLRKFPEIVNKMGVQINWNPCVEETTDILLDDNRSLPHVDFDTAVKVALSIQLRDNIDAEEWRNDDWAETLGVVKYDPPVPAELAGQVKGSFPSFIQKTDQERIQNMPEILDDLEAEYEVSVKLDGTSVTVYVNDGEVGVCSRNLELKISEENKDNSLVKLAGLLTPVLKNIPGTGSCNFAVQGELMGPGIQGNREALKEATFFVFDIFDINKGEYVTPQVREWIMQMLSPTGVKHVPILHKAFKISELQSPTVEGLLAFAEGPSINHAIREGLVFKRKDGQLSFKAIANKFLLKQKD